MLEQIQAAAQWISTHTTLRPTVAIVLGTGLAHIGEAGTGGEVLAAQRMFGEEIDVIGDEHHVADAHFGSKAARSVGNKEGLIPNSYMTRMGKVTCFMSYPS